MSDSSSSVAEVDNVEESNKPRSKLDNTLSRMSERNGNHVMEMPRLPCEESLLHSRTVGHGCHSRVACSVLYGQTVTSFQLDYAFACVLQLKAARSSKVLPPCLKHEGSPMGLPRSAIRLDDVNGPDQPQPALSDGHAHDAGCIRDQVQVRLSFPSRVFRRWHGRMN